MHYYIIRYLVTVLAVPAALASPFPNANAYDTALLSRRDTSANNNLTVDLGYAVYQGVNNATQGLNSWKGYANHVVTPGQYG